MTPPHRATSSFAGFLRRRAAAATDQDAFADALLEQLPMLRRYAIGLVGDVTSADDFVQDAIERAIRRRATLGDPSRLRAWLRTILRNLYFDALRQKRSRGESVEIDQLADELALSAPPEDRGVALDLHRALGRVTAEHREVLLLVGVEGLSYREIADELGVPIGTVMSRVARARDRLALALDGATAGGPGVNLEGGIKAQSGEHG